MTEHPQPSLPEIVVVCAVLQGVPVCVAYILWLLWRGLS